MRRINEAWRILSSTARRAEYDRAHPAAGTPAAPSGPLGAHRAPIRPPRPTDDPHLGDLARHGRGDARRSAHACVSPGEVQVAPDSPAAAGRPPSATFRDTRLGGPRRPAIVILLLLDRRDRGREAG